MARALAVRRVRVAAGRQAEWLAALAALERLERAEGRHVWVFRHPEERDTFLEFSESGDRATHWSVVPAAGAGALLDRLESLASYEDPRPVLWEEVPLIADTAKGS